MLQKLKKAVCGGCHLELLQFLVISVFFLVQVRERMQHLKEDLFEKVAAVLESPSEASNGQAALRAALAGRWQAALDKAARFWERHGTGSSAQRADLQAPLQDLHQYIHSTIDAEVSIVHIASAISKPIALIDLFQWLGC